MAKASGVKVMIMFGQRFRDCNIEARRLVSEGAIGKVKMIQEQILAGGGLASLPAWQSQPQNVGIFYRSRQSTISTAFVGSPARKFASVSAQVQRDPVSGNEVSTMALLSLTNGAMATIWASWQIASPAFPRSASAALIAGDKRQSGTSTPTASCVLARTRNGLWSPCSRSSTGLARVRFRRFVWRLIAGSIKSFIDAIREDRTPSVTGEDGRAAVEVAVAAYKSAAEGRTIHLRSGITQ